MKKIFGPLLLMLAFASCTNSVSEAEQSSDVNTTYEANCSEIQKEFERTVVRYFSKNGVPEVGTKIENMEYLGAPESGDTVLIESFYKGSNDIHHFEGDLCELGSDVYAVRVPAAAPE